jgi:Icc-related predicted phosphoesterase
MFRIVFAADLHGSTPVFNKLLNLIMQVKVDYVIINGDLTGKYLVSIINKDRKQYIIRDNHFVEVNDNELAKLIKTWEMQGMYYKVLSEEEYNKFKENPSLIETEVEKLALERLDKWLSYALDRLKNTNIKLLINAGNDDTYSVDNVLKKYDGDTIVFSEDKVITLKDGNEMITAGYANKTPWNCPRDLTEEELYKVLEEKISKIKNMRKAIFNVHVPPYGTIIDKAPKPDKNAERAITSLGHVIMESVGSRSVRQLIEKYQPMLTLHGHIHEGKGACKIGRSICINPGSEYMNGILNYALILIDNDKVKDYIITSG